MSAIFCRCGIRCVATEVKFAPLQYGVTAKSERLIFSTYSSVADNTHFSRVQFKYILTEQLVSSENIHSNGIIFFHKCILIHPLKHKNDEINRTVTTLNHCKIKPTLINVLV